MVPIVAKILHSPFGRGADGALKEGQLPAENNDPGEWITRLWRIMSSGEKIKNKAI